MTSEPDQNPAACLINRLAIRAVLPAVALALCLMLVVPITWSHAQPIHWLREREVAAAMDQEVSLTWSGVPLRDGLHRLVGTQRMAVVLDRRVDPGRLITTQMSNVSLEDALKRLTRTRKLGFAVLSGVIYIGPSPAAARLRTVAALRRKEADSLPEDRRRVVLERVRWEWDDLSVPGELLVQTARASGFQLEGVDQVPHDLWAATSLPPLSLVDRVTLVANQFDLTFRFSADGRTLTLVPVADSPTLERRYPGGRDPQARIRRFRALIPAARIGIRNGQIFVRGRIEEHEQLTASIRPDTSPRKPQRGEEVYQLNLQDVPVGKVIKELGRRLGLDVRIDEGAIRAANLSLDQLITVRIKDAKLDELLEAVLKPANLAFRREGLRVDVGPKVNR